MKYSGPTDAYVKKAEKIGKVIIRLFANRQGKNEKQDPFQFPSV